MDFGSRDAIVQWSVRPITVVHFSLIRRPGYIPLKHVPFQHSVFAKYMFSGICQSVNERRTRQARVPASQTVRLLGLFRGVSPPAVRNEHRKRGTSLTLLEAFLVRVETLLTLNAFGHVVVAVLMPLWARSLRLDLGPGG